MASRPWRNGGLIELRASDLRQFLYCPRVVYFSHVVPIARVETFKMKAGRQAELQHARLERRRSLRRYGLEDGERQYSVALRCDTLGVSGIVDEVVYGPQAPVPIDVKMTEGGAAMGHKVQLAVYAMALEEQAGCPVARGFIHLVPKNRVVAIPIDERLRAITVDIARRIRLLIATEAFPSPADRPAKCDGCELRCFCNDVY
jgi:CRISPR-associated exonuclease Cas4